MRVSGSLDLKRSIPAWAGETYRAKWRRSTTGVYPRVGGGNRTGEFKYYNPIGLSPRGRGKRWRKCRQLQNPRSIPAWAGETYRA